MSRHRYVRNLDLDAELADDAGGEYDYDGGSYSGEASGDEPDDGMTPEERAQMASALPIVRENLKDIKPPIPDAAIQDSLWHYWFDVDKASSWLRKDREKKGDPSIALPADLFPTPDQDPRPRPSRKQPKSGMSPLRAELEETKEGMSSLQDAPAPPLSALQRLSLARKQQHAAAASSPTTTPQEAAKPMSKLALLAQKRRENKTPPIISSPVAQTPPSPRLAPTSPSDTVKPMSKLAQKMAAARAARAEGPRSTPPMPTTAEVDTTAARSPADEVVTEEAWSLFPSASETSAPPSTFFNLLTTHSADNALPNPPSLANMHIAVRGDLAVAEQRVRDAFGPGVESPDDIVLRKRDGRAGTAGAGPSTEPRQVQTAVRAEKTPAASADVRSEAEAARAKHDEAHSVRPGGGSSTTGRRGSAASSQSASMASVQSSSKASSKSGGKASGKPNNAKKPGNAGSSKAGDTGPKAKPKPNSKAKGLAPSTAPGEHFTSSAPKSSASKNAAGNGGVGSKSVPGGPGSNAKPTAQGKAPKSKPPRSGDSGDKPNAQLKPKAKPKPNSNASEKAQPNLNTGATAGEA